MSIEESEVTENFSDYNYEAREKAVLDKLEILLKEIQDENISDKFINASRHVGSFMETEDKTIAFLKKKQDEISELKTEVEAYDNPDNHFTKQYRTLFGHLGKMQQDLDAIDVIDREDLRTLRKKAYTEIDELTIILGRKAHSDGRLCPGCEVKD